MPLYVAKWSLGSEAAHVSYLGQDAPGDQRADAVEADQPRLASLTLAAMRSLTSALAQILAASACSMDAAGSPRGDNAWRAIDSALDNVRAPTLRPSLGEEFLAGDVASYASAWAD